MGKTRIILSLLVLVLLFSGCKTTTTSEGDKVTTRTNGDSVITEIESVDGKQKTTVKGTTGTDDWCPTGGNWQMTSSGTKGDSSASWKIDKIETSEEYEGYCHVIYTAQGTDGDVRMDYWFEEGGENGYFEIDAGGQKIKQEWHNSDE